MSLIIIYWIITLIWSIHYVVNFSQIISYAISFASLINSIGILSSRNNFKLNPLRYPIILLFFNIVILIIINLIKKQELGFYSLKFVQVITFLLPAYFLGWNYDQIRKKVTIQLLIFLFVIFQYLSILIPGSLISGCIFCLDNYVYGMRLVPGLNSMGNSIFVLILLLLSLKSASDISAKAWCPAPQTATFLGS